MTLLNAQQRQILGHPGKHVLAFVQSEWLKAIIGICVGIVAGLLKELFRSDHTFKAFAANKWSLISSQKWFDATLPYGAYLAALAVIAVVTIAIGLAPRLYRILKSFARGVVGGTIFLWALSFFALLDYDAPPRIHEISLALLVACGFSTASLTLYLCGLLASLREQKPIRAYSAAAEQPSLPENRWSNSISDSPISDWEQDILNRSPFVESLISAIMVSKAPVVAIHGAYGDGKTSILHLLGKSLKDHAIVVPFITWLPGSRDNLAIEVFDNIATECKGHYYVPRLRKKSLAYAKSLCEAVPYVKAFSDLVPSTSQQEDIEDLEKSLRRLPVRIVVLLDEMDRMEEEELRVLLKIIRGVSAFPNLSYVCALNRHAVEKILPKMEGVDEHEYFEKFFPATFELPRVDSDLLFRLLSTKLTSLLETVYSFRNQNERKQFDKSLRNVWNDSLISLCTNIRKVSLILNDVEFGIRPISSEVNPFDFVVLEALRRFFPDIYDYIWKNEQFFAESTQSWKETFDPDGVKKERDAKFQELKNKMKLAGRENEISNLLWYLFPKYSEYYNPSESQMKKRGPDLEKGESDRRIFHPDYFPVYFRYQVPATVFSESEINAFISGMSGKDSQEESEKFYTTTLSQIPKGSLKRQSFLHRIGGAVGRLADLHAEALPLAIAANSSEYSYDMTWTAGEAGDALKAVLEVANRFAGSPTLQRILENVILRSTDDTFALRVLAWFTEPAKHEISTDFSRLDKASLKNVFINRMQNRYNEHTVITDHLLSTADRDAFVQWTAHSDKAREMEVSFWKKFIDGDQRRLAQAVTFIFPGNVVWSVGPAPLVDKLFPLSEFQRLIDNLPQANHLEDHEREALDRLQKLLRGEYANGYDPTGFLG